MRIGDKIACIKEYIDNDYDYDVQFTKGKIYTICEVDENNISVSGEVQYHITNGNITYLCHGFSLIENKPEPDCTLYFNDYFIDIRKYRKQKLKKINRKEKLKKL